MRFRKRLAATAMVLVVLAGLTGCQQAAVPLAALQASFNGGIYRFEVRSDGGGYPLRLACIRGCPKAVERTEKFADHPLGLFARDSDDLVFYLSSSGSAYQIRAWKLSASGAEQVADLPSRSLPIVGNGTEGEARIQVTEAIRPGKWRSIDWTFRDGRFQRTDGSTDR